VKFCPKCRGIMMPTRRGNKTYIRCQRCGYEEELGRREAREYVDKRRVEERPSAVIVKGAEDEALSEEERELLEDYHKQLLDNLYEAEREAEED